MIGLAQSPGSALNRVIALCLMLVIILGITINHLDLSDDPYRCKALMQEGSWLNAPDANGSRAPFTKWQPQGCMLHEYQKEEIVDCMEGRHMLFFGDSTTRQIFYGMARLVSWHRSHDTDQGGFSRHVRLPTEWFGSRASHRLGAALCHKPTH